MVFQFVYLKLPLRYVFNLFAGLAMALVGVAVFLQGVRVGFFPAGTEIGSALGEIRHMWVLVPVGCVMGLLATLGEPAVRILSDEVEKASGGSIKRAIVLLTIAVGVALFIGLGMVRIVYGIPLFYIIGPGYGLAIAMLLFSDKSTVSIAVDAGGVATGPIAVTFLLAIAVGIAAAIEGRDPVIDGFGLIALIALAPILSILTLGLAVRIRLRKKG
ncbi:MAG: DUF1538 domain-containing protein [Dehalococcoidia bacterium]|nr:DUF1538 domain-containing protein [Dehalococcoidia bacterium]